MADYKIEYNKRLKEEEIDKKEMETEIKSRTQGSEFTSEGKEKKKQSDTKKDADFDKIVGEKDK